MSANNLNLLRQSRDTYGAEFENHLFDQYKLYVEMADRISSRRMLANSFFVGVHTTLTIAFTVLLKENLLQPTLLIFVPFIALVLLCYIWWRVVCSYRQLNTGKYKVILALEQMLPVAPYDAEWTALGEGKKTLLSTYGRRKVGANVFRSAIFIAGLHILLPLMFGYEICEDFSKMQG